MAATTPGTTRSWVTVQMRRETVFLVAGVRNVDPFDGVLVDEEVGDELHDRSVVDDARCRVAGVAATGGGRLRRDIRGRLREPGGGFLRDSLTGRERTPVLVSRTSSFAGRGARQGAPVFQAIVDEAGGGGEATGP
jgi:hypothetical protein